MNYQIAVPCDTVLSVLKYRIFWRTFIFQIESFRVKVLKRNMDSITQFDQVYKMAVSKLICLFLCFPLGAFLSVWGRLRLCCLRASPELLTRLEWSCHLPFLLYLHHKLITFLFKHRLHLSLLQGNFKLLLGHSGLFMVFPQFV